jgi:hypothetical protein
VHCEVSFINVLPSCIALIKTVSYGPTNAYVLEYCVGAAAVAALVVAVVVVVTVKLKFLLHAMKSALS